MAVAPSGTVTLLFTGIVASTELRVRLGDDEAERVRRAHFDVMREAVRAHEGREVKTMGDGFMVAFSSALRAIECAISMQEGVHHANASLEESERLELRVGLDAGEVTHEEGDYFGTPVVVAKRLCDLSEGGQILVSDLVRGLVGSRGGLAFGSKGELAARGLDPVSAWEVPWEPAPPRAPAPSDEPLTQPPLPSFIAVDDRSAFVGRAQELRALLQAWGLAAGGRRQFVFVSGESGIGKTRLAAELGSAVHRQGGAIMYGRCSEDTSLPGQPFRSAIRQYYSSWPPTELEARAGAAGAALAELAPELFGRLPEPEASGRGEAEKRHHIAEAITAVLTEACRSHPVLLILDDLHCADEATLSLLRDLSRTTKQVRLLIVGTYQEADMSRGHPLSGTLADLRKEGLFERLDLLPLDQDDIASLVAAWTGLTGEPTLARAICQRTDGNPFFVEEVLRHLLETDAMGDLATALRTIRTGIPTGVKEVIARRLSRLSEQCESILTIASVIGREFDLEALERAGDLSRDELLRVLEEAIAADVISEQPAVAGRYSFSHTLVYETLYDDLTTTRRVHINDQTLQYADNDGVKLAYQVLGASGPYVVPVNLSAGPTFRTRVRSSARRWEVLGHRCRMIFYDRRGVGCSAAPERGYSTMAAVEDLRAVLDAAGCERPFLWGSTDGGPLAITFAVHYPDRTAGLILAGTTAKFLNDDEFHLGVDKAVTDSFLRTDPVDQGLAVSEHIRNRQSEGTTEIREVIQRVPRRVWTKVAGGLGAGDARALLERVAVPTLIIHDPGNTYIPVEAAHYLHERIPGSQLEITDEYGPVWGEGLYETVYQFMERVSGAS